MSDIRKKLFFFFIQPANSNLQGKAKGTRKHAPRRLPSPREKEMHGKLTCIVCSQVWQRCGQGKVGAWWTENVVIEGGSSVSKVVPLEGSRLAWKSQETSLDNWTELYASVARKDKEARNIQRTSFTNTPSKENSRSTVFCPGNKRSPTPRWARKA